MEDTEFSLASLVKKWCRFTRNLCRNTVSRRWSILSPLLKSGICIATYFQRVEHGKVAVLVCLVALTEHGRLGGVYTTEVYFSEY